MGESQLSRRVAQVYRSKYQERFIILKAGVLQDEQTGPEAIETEREAFFLRITGHNDYRYEGADLGILITRGRSMTDEFTLNQRAYQWIRGIKNYYQAKLLAPVAEPTVPAPGAFKIL